MSIVIRDWRRQLVYVFAKTDQLCPNKWSSSRFVDFPSMKTLNKYQSGNDGNYLSFMRKKLKLKCVEYYICKPIQNCAYQWDKKHNYRRDAQIWKKQMLCHCDICHYLSYSPKEILTIATN